MYIDVLTHVCVWTIILILAVLFVPLGLTFLIAAIGMAFGVGAITFVVGSLIFSVMWLYAHIKGLVKSFHNQKI